LNISGDHFKDENFYEIHILTMDGVQMISKKVSKEMNQLNIGGLAPGNYLIILEGTNQFKQQVLRVK
jgi:hypothetical protein